MSEIAEKAGRSQLGCLVLSWTDESNLDLAKHFLRNEKDAKKAIRYLKRIKPTGWVSEAGLEEAASLLRQAKRQINE